jgi:TRAP-type C4-dicarboxylate transport system permease small subunit
MLRNSLSGIIGGLRRIVEAFVIVLFVIMISFVLIQIAGRYVFNYSISGTEELALFAQVWMVMMGCGVAMRFGRHVAVDLLVTSLPIPIARALNLFIGLGCLWFLYIVFVGAMPIVQIGFIETAPGLGIPMWPIYLSLNVGVVYFGIEVVMWIARRWDDPYGKYETRETGD